MISVFEGLGCLEVSRLILYLFEWIAGLAICGAMAGPLTNFKAGTCYFGAFLTCKSVIGLTALATSVLSITIFYQVVHYFKSTEKECMSRKAEGIIFLALSVIWVIIGITLAAATPWSKISVWGISVLIVALANMKACMWSAFIPYYELKQGKGMLDTTLGAGPKLKGRFSQTLEAI